MRPGVVYSAPALAARFGVSATPVREAMLDLAKEGLVSAVRNKGFRVTEVEVPMAHRATGGDWRAQLHRARQFADVAWALAVRESAVQTRVETARHALRRPRG